MQNYYSPYYNPSLTPQQRLNVMEQQYPQFSQPVMNQMQGMNMGNMNGMGQQMNGQSFLKGRAVTSIDEAKASMIDLDGSLFVFTDLANGKIYTKQITLDGTAMLNTYNIEPSQAPQKPNNQPTQQNTSIVDLSALEHKIMMLEDEMGVLKERMVFINESNANNANVYTNKGKSKSATNDATNDGK